MRIMMRIIGVSSEYHRVREKEKNQKKERRVYVYYISLSLCTILSISSYISLIVLYLSLIDISYSKNISCI